MICLINISYRLIRDAMLLNNDTILRIERINSQRTHRIECLKKFPEFLLEKVPILERLTPQFQRTPATNFNNVYYQADSIKSSFLVPSSTYYLVSPSSNFEVSSQNLFHSPVLVETRKTCPAVISVEFQTSQKKPLDRRCRSLIE